MDLPPWNTAAKPTEGGADDDGVSWTAEQPHRCAAAKAPSSNAATTAIVSADGTVLAVAYDGSAAVTYTYVTETAACGWQSVPVQSDAAEADVAPREVTHVADTAEDTAAFAALAGTSVRRISLEPSLRTALASDKETATVASVPRDGTALPAQCDVTCHAATAAVVYLLAKPSENNTDAEQQDADASVSLEATHLYTIGPQRTTAASLPPALSGATSVVPMDGGRSLYFAVPAPDDAGRGSSDADDAPAEADAESPVQNTQQTLTTSALYAVHLPADDNDGESNTDAGGVRTLAARRLGSLPAPSGRLLRSPDGFVFAAATSSTALALFSMPLPAAASDESAADAGRQDASGSFATGEWTLLPATVGSSADVAVDFSSIRVFADWRAVALSTDRRTAFLCADVRADGASWATVALAEAAETQGDASEEAEPAQEVANAEAEETGSRAAQTPNADDECQEAAVDEADSGNEDEPQPADAAPAPAPAGDSHNNTLRASTANGKSNSSLKPLTPAERGRVGLAPLPPPPSQQRSRRVPTAIDERKPGSLLPLLTPRRGASQQRGGTSSRDDDPRSPAACGPTGAPVLLSAKAIAAKTALQHMLVRSLLASVRRVESIGNEEGKDSQQPQQRTSPQRKRSPSPKRATQTGDRNPKPPATKRPAATARRNASPATAPQGKSKSASPPRRASDRGAVEGDADASDKKPKKAKARKRRAKKAKADGVSPWDSPDEGEADDAGPTVTSDGDGDDGKPKEEQPEPSPDDKGAAGDAETKPTDDNTDAAATASASEAAPNDATGDGTAATVGEGDSAPSKKDGGSGDGDSANAEKDAEKPNAEADSEPTKTEQAEESDAAAPAASPSATKEPANGDAAKTEEDQSPATNDSADATTKNADGAANSAEEALQEANEAKGTDAGAEEGSAEDGATPASDGAEAEAETEAKPDKAKPKRKPRRAASPQRTADDSRGRSPQRAKRPATTESAMPSEPLLLALDAATRKGVKRTTVSLASCPNPSAPADMLLLSRVIEGAPSITGLDLAGKHFNAIATGQLSATITASPHLLHLNTVGASFDDPTVAIVLESQVDRNARMREDLVAYRRMLRHEEKARAAAQTGERKVVVRRLNFYKRQRSDMETRELLQRVVVEAVWAMRLCLYESEMILGAIYDEFIAGRRLREAIEAHLEAQRAEREAVEQECSDADAELNREQAQQWRTTFQRWEDERLKLHRREVDLAKAQRRQRDTIEREEKSLRMRQRRDEEDKRTAVMDEETRGRRKIKERIEDQRRRQREAEIAELMRQNQIKQEEQMRREAKEQQDKEHRRERESLEKDELKTRENISADEKKFRKDVQVAHDASHEVATRWTLYNAREEQRKEAACKPNTVVVDGIADAIHVVQGNVLTPVALRGAEVRVDFEKPPYMQEMFDVIAANANKGPRTTAGPMTKDQERALLASHGVNLLEAHEITNEEWCERKVTFHGAVIHCTVSGAHVPATDVMSLCFDFDNGPADFTLLSDAVLVQKSTGDQIGTVQKAPHDIRISIDGPQATLETLNALIQSLAVYSRARSPFSCDVNLTVRGVFGVPTSTTNRSHLEIQANKRRGLGRSAIAAPNPAASTGPGASSPNTVADDGSPGGPGGADGVVPMPPPLLDEQAFEIDPAKFEFSAASPASAMSVNPAASRRQKSASMLLLSEVRILDERACTYTLATAHHAPLFVMGDLAVTRLVYAENAGDVPVLTGLENFALDMISWEGVTVTADLGPLMDVADSVVFGPPKPNAKVEVSVDKQTVSVKGALLATIVQPGILSFPANKQTKEVGMPTRFELVLRATATREGLVSLLQHLCFRNHASQPVSGTRHFKLSVLVPEKRMQANAAIDVDVVQEDQPTVFDIGFSPVVCRSPYAVADDLLPLVTNIDNPCYFAASSVVYDFDTADFNGGYLHLYIDPAEMETDPSAVSIRVVPYAGSSVQLASPQGGAVTIDDVEIGMLTYPSPSALMVRFGEHASVNAVGALFRSIVFHSQSDRGQTRIVRCVFVAGRGADPVKTSFEVLLDDALILHSTGMVRVPSGISEPQPLGPFSLGSSHGQWDGGFLLVDYPNGWSSEDTVNLVPGAGVTVQALTQREQTRLQTELNALIAASQAAFPTPGEPRRRQEKDKDQIVGVIPDRKGFNNKGFLKKKLPEKLRDVVGEKARAHEDVRLRQLLAARKAFNLNISEGAVLSGSKAVHVDGTKVATMIQSSSFILMLFDGAKKPTYSLTTITPDTAHGNIPQRAVSSILSRLHFSGNLGIKSVRFSASDGHPHMSLSAMQVEIGCSDEVTRLNRPLSPRTFRCRSTDDDEGFCLFGDVQLENPVIRIFNGAVIEAGFSGNSQSAGDQLSLLTVAQQITRGIPPSRRITVGPATVADTTAAAADNADGGEAGVAGPGTDADSRGGGIGVLMVGGCRVGIVCFDAPNPAGTSNIRIVFDKLDPAMDPDELLSRGNLGSVRGVVTLSLVQEVLNAITYTNVAATVKAGSRVCHCTVGHDGAEGKLSLVLAVKAPTLFSSKPHTLPRLLGVDMKWNAASEPTTAASQADVSASPSHHHDSASSPAHKAPRRGDVGIIDAESEGGSDDDAGDDECLTLLVCPDAVLNVPNTSAPVKEGCVTVTILKRAPQEDGGDPSSPLVPDDASGGSPGASSGMLGAPISPQANMKRRRSQQATAAAACFDTSIVFSGGVDWSQLTVPAQQLNQSTSGKSQGDGAPPPSATLVEAPPPPKTTLAVPGGGGAGPTRKASSTTNTVGSPVLTYDTDGPLIQLSSTQAAGASEDAEVGGGGSADHVFIALDTDYQLQATSVAEGSFRAESRRRSSIRRAPTTGSPAGKSLATPAGAVVVDDADAASDPPKSVAADARRASSISPSGIEALSNGLELFHIAADGALFIARQGGDDGDDDDSTAGGTSAAPSVAASEARGRGSAAPTPHGPRPTTTSAQASPAPARPDAASSSRSGGSSSTAASTLDPFDGYEMLYAGKVLDTDSGGIEIAFDYRSEMTIARLQALLRRLKLVVRRDFARKMIQSVGVHVFYLEVSWVSRDAAPDVMIVPVAAMPLHRNAAVAHYKSVVPREPAGSSTGNHPLNTSDSKKGDAASPKKGDAAADGKANKADDAKTPKPPPGKPAGKRSSSFSVNTAGAPASTQVASAPAEECSGPVFFSGVAPAYIQRTGMPTHAFHGVALDRHVATESLLDGLGLPSSRRRNSRANSMSRGRSDSLRRSGSRRASEHSHGSHQTGHEAAQPSAHAPPATAGKAVFFIIDVESRLPQTVQAALTTDGTPLRVALESLQSAAGEWRSISAAEQSSSMRSPTRGGGGGGGSPLQALRAGDLIDFDVMAPLALQTAGTPAGGGPRPPRGASVAAAGKHGASFRHPTTGGEKSGFFGGRGNQGAAGQPPPPGMFADTLGGRAGKLIRSSDNHVAFAYRFDVDSTTTKHDAERAVDVFLACAEALLRTLTIQMAANPTVVSRQSERWLTVKFSRSVFDQTSVVGDAPPPQKEGAMPEANADAPAADAWDGDEPPPASHEPAAKSSSRPASAGQPPADAPENSADGEETPAAAGSKPESGERSPDLAEEPPAEEAKLSSSSARPAASDAAGDSTAAAAEPQKEPSSPAQDPFDTSLSTALHKRLARRTLLDPRDRVFGLFKFALAVQPSPMFLPGIVRRLGFRFRVAPPAGTGGRGGRRESVAALHAQLPTIVENVMTSGTPQLPLSNVFQLRPKAGGSLMTFREGGTMLLRLTYAACQPPLAPQSGFKFPRVVFDEALCHLTAKKARERDVAPLLGGIPLSDIGAAPLDLREFALDNKRVAVSATGTIATAAFNAMNVPTTSPGGAGAPGSTTLGGTMNTVASSNAANNAPNNHNLVVAVPPAPNGASRSNLTLKMIAGFAIDFTDVNLSQPVTFACTLVLTDAATGMSDTTTVIIVKESLGAEKPPRARRTVGAAAAAVAAASGSRRTAVTPNTPLRAQRNSTGSGERKSTLNSRPGSSSDAKRGDAVGFTKSPSQTPPKGTPRGSGSNTPKERPVSAGTAAAVADGDDDSRKSSVGDDAKQ